MCIENLKEILEKASLVYDFDDSGRKVSISENRYVIKEFKLNKRQLKKRLWEVEHFAINKLNEIGINSPKSYFYLNDNDSIKYVKSYVEGSPLAQYTEENLLDLSCLLQLIYKGGLITRDMHKENVVRNENGKLFLIDLGCARIYEKKTLAYYKDLGRELVSIRGNICDRDKRKFECFSNHYFQNETLAFKSAVMFFFYTYGTYAKLNQLRKNLKKKFVKNYRY